MSGELFALAVVLVAPAGLLLGILAVAALVVASLAQASSAADAQSHAVRP